MKRTASVSYQKPHIKTRFYESPFKVLRQVLVRSRAIWIMLLAALFLSGCVHYDVGITFDNPNRGKIVQQIQLGERLTAFSSQAAQQWLKQLEQRARQFQGKTQRVGNQQLTVTIPFYNGADLETKFNQFFDASTINAAAKSKSQKGELLNLPDFHPHLTLKQNNFLLVIRNRLSYDIDLRPLGVVSANGNLLISPGSLLDLDLKLQAPWGIRNIKPATAALNPPATTQQKHEITWTLQPGQLNHLEAIFWLPNPLGIGALAIILLMLGGFYWKYRPDWRKTQLSAPNNESIPSS